ncbi:MAG: ATP-binding protein [Prevotellaceae bacterium]|jgi:hypothetical protein|nr:ATP-binding protein [Prevotellaceae bacterium]
METKLKKLPIGIQTFEEIRSENYIYVDKTMYLVKLIDSGKIYFFARPRRFGKSLTVSTFEAMFSGKKELFEGLAAEEFMNRANYRTSPVIRLDMSDVTTNEGIAAFSKSVKKLVLDQAIIQDVELDIEDAPGEMLSSLIRKIYREKGKQKVVILLDEYDKPYSDFVNDHEMAEKIREVLRNFYVRIKTNDEYIRFVFITGIAKFAKFGVFSGLNNPEDISIDKKYGEICGLTEAEIVKYFPEYIEETAEEMNITSDELLEKMRNYYDGFCFDGVHRLYNPFSTVNFFAKKDFLNFWVKSGTSKLIADYLKTRKLTVEQFRNFPVSKDFLDEPGEMDSTPPEGFLYQGGYLTIREGKIRDYALDYPNTEVLNAMSALLSQNILSYTNENRLNVEKDLTNALVFKRIDDLIGVFNRFLASIPYDDFEYAAKQNISMEGIRLPAQEWLYRSCLFSFMQGNNLVVNAEVHNNKGRADLVIDCRGNTYVIELKVAYQPKDIPAKLAEAVEQMKTKNYLAPYPNATGLAIVIDDTKRQITDDSYTVI